MYLKVIYLDEALDIVLSSVKSSITNFISTQGGYLIISFAVFAFVLAIGVLISATLGMDFLYEHYSATKSILNLIPGKKLIELSEKTDLK